MKEFLVFKYSKAIDPLKINFLKQFLPLSRQKKLNEIKNEKQKEISIIEYFMVKFALKLKGLPDFEYNEYGKPFIKNAMYFNISHSGDFIVVAISKNPIGVDIQKKSRYNNLVAKRICSKSQLSQLTNAKNQDEQLIKLWTLKESYIKMKGLSLLFDIKDINEKTEGCKFFQFEIDGYKLCICEKTYDC